MNDGERKLVEFQLGMSGSFYTYLFKAMFKADSVNTIRLAKGFPEEVEAVRRYQNEDGYWDKVWAEYK